MHPLNRTAASHACNRVVGGERKRCEDPCCFDAWTKSGDFRRQGHGLPALARLKTHLPLINKRSVEEVIPVPVERHPPTKDLTTEGVEPNPGPVRRVRSRKPAPQRSLRAPLTDVNTVARWCAKANVASSSSFPIFDAIAFSLDMLPNYTEFTALYDLYRIVRAEVLMIPNIVNANSATPLSGLTAHVCDFDDATVPASLNELYQYGDGPGRCVLQGPTEKIYRSLEPRAAAAVYSGAFTSYATTPRSQWMNCSSPGVQYYGFKYGFGLSNSVVIYTVNVRLTVQFRKTR